MQGGKIVVVPITGNGQYVWSTSVNVPNDRPIRIEAASGPAYPAAKGQANQRGVSVLYTGSGQALGTSGGTPDSTHPSFVLKDISFELNNSSYTYGLNLLNLQPEFAGHVNVLGIGTAAVAPPSGSIAFNFDYGTGSGGNGFEATINSIGAVGFDTGVRVVLDHPMFNHIYVEACNHMLQLGSASYFPNAFTANYVHLYTHANFAVTDGVLCPTTGAIFPNGIINHLYFEPTAGGSYTNHFNFVATALTNQFFLVNRMHGQSTMHFTGTAASHVRTLVREVGATYYDFNVNTPALPGGTGSGNTVQNPNWFPVWVYITNPTVPGHLATHLIDPSGLLDTAVADQFPLCLLPYAKIYFNSNLPGSWAWQASPG